MAFLFDTTALSELTKPSPNEGFITWMRGQDTEEAYISCLSIGELALGIALLPPSKRRRGLEEWLETLTHQFGDRILAFDTECARAWGYLIAHARRSNLALPVVDSQLAATAVVHSLTVVTRNVRHFTVDGFDGLRVLNPWN